MKIGSITISDSEFLFEFVRSKGAGGQNVNKVNSKAVLRWNVLNSPGLPETVRQRFLLKWQRRITEEGFIIITSSRFRDQIRNKEDALLKLETMIEEVRIPPKKRLKTKPTKASKERKLQDKKQRSKLKSTRKSNNIEW